MDSRNYRPEIDGLRAIAVLAVLFYHLDYRAFSGGFVGVDIFFVISGYLITRLIRDEVSAAGDFDFGKFYVRRARRLFPALFVVCAASFVAAVFIFSPDDLHLFAGSSIYALTSLSNFYFWGQSGYFDAAANVKPLLHTWSLAVEEQFYLIWPAYLVLVSRAPRAAVGALGAASLALNFAFQGGGFGDLATLPPGVSDLFADGRSTIFYLTPFRIFEFAIGAALIWIPRARGAASEALLTLGLVLAVAPFFLFSVQTLFPTYNALLPCIGAALSIIAGEARISGFFLRNRASVFIGKISYSLYLVHWPIIVFAAYARPEAFSASDKALIVATSVVLAAVMYRFVETPFRRPAPVRAPLSGAGFGLACALLSLSLICFAASAWADGGWAWRRRAPAIADFAQLDRLQNETLDFAASTVDLSTFFTKKIRTLVIGDSHSIDVGIALTDALGETHEVRRLELHAKCWRYMKSPSARETMADCREEIGILSQTQKLRAADIVVIANLYFGDEIDDAQNAIDFIHAARPDVKVIFLGRAVEFWRFHEFVLKEFEAGAAPAAVNEAAYEKYFAFSEETDRVSRSKIKQDRSTVYVSRVSAMCSDRECTFITPDRRLALWDHTHWTREGGKIFIRRLIAQNAGVFDLAAADF